MSCSTNATPWFRKLTIDYNGQAQKDDHVLKIHVYLLLLSAISCLLPSLSFNALMIFMSSSGIRIPRDSIKINNWDQVFLGLSYVAGITALLKMREMVHMS